MKKANIVLSLEHKDGKSYARFLDKNGIPVKLTFPWEVSEEKLLEEIKQGIWSYGV